MSSDLFSEPISFSATRAKLFFQLSDNQGNLLSLLRVCDSVMARGLPGDWQNKCGHDYLKCAPI